MSRSRWVTCAVAAGLSGLFGVIAAAVPAAAAATPGWRVVASRNYPQGTTVISSYSAVVAPSKTDAWVFGGSGNGPGGAQLPEAQHWNGKTWQPAALPSGVTGTIVAASAPAANDIWAVTGNTGYVLHYNGSRWSVALKLPETGYYADFTGVTALSSSDVWVFGGVLADFTDLVGHGTYHFNGSRWTHVGGEGRNIVAASAISAGDIWGIGGYLDSGDGVQHFTHGAWKSVKVPAGVGYEREVLAVSAQQVWVDGRAANSGAPTLIRWNGKAWQQLPVHAPAGADLLYGISPDGSGGIWIAAQSPSNSQMWMLHRSAAGQWTSTALGSGHLMGGTVLVPGTHSLWGAGQSEQGPGYATIYAEGAIP